MAALYVQAAVGGGIQIFFLHTGDSGFFIRGKTARELHMFIKRIKTFLKIGFLALAIFFSGTLTAQENTQINSNLLNIYESELFSWSYSTFGGPSLNLYNQSSSPFFFGINRTMRTALELYPDTSQEYDSYKRKNITGTVLQWGGLAAILAGSLLPVMRISGNRDTKMIISASAMGAGALSLIGGAIVSSSALEDLFSAVTNYNRNKMRGR